MFAFEHSLAEVEPGSGLLCPLACEFRAGVHEHALRHQSGLSRDVGVPTSGSRHARGPAVALDAIREGSIRIHHDCCINSSPSGWK
eukprot:15474510-Alexandrium_andersonii.AAC.1